MEFEKYVKLIEADISGSGDYPAMIHGRDPDLKDNPEEKNRMIESLIGKSVSVIFGTGTLRLRIDGVLSKSTNRYNVTPEGQFEGVTRSDFTLVNVEKVVTDIKGTEGMTLFSIHLKI